VILNYILTLDLQREPKYLLARTQLLPLHMNVLNIMNDALRKVLYILSLLGKRRGVMWVNKIFYVVLSGCDSCKSKLHNTEILQTAYLLVVQATFPINVHVFSKHRKQYFAKKYLLQSNSQKPWTPKICLECLLCNNQSWLTSQIFNHRNHRTWM